MTNPTASSASTPLTPATPSRGRFVWYDLVTSDPDAAFAFYGAVAGWGEQAWEGNADYRMITASGVPIGGVMKPTPEMGPVPPHWTAHITVPDVDEAVKQVEALGGSVLAPASDIPKVGRFALIADPQGAAVSIYTPGQSMPEREGMPPVGEFSWNELLSSDASAGFEFYSKLLGWEHASDFDMGPMGTYRLFQRNGQMLGGMMNKPADAPMPTSWLYYIRVDSADAAAERVKAAGGQVLNGPVEVPGGDRIAQCVDPQGAMFAVHSSTSA